MNIENGIIVDTPYWFWCIYDTEKTANAVRRAIVLVKPDTSVSNVSFLIYSGMNAYGFRLYK